MRILFFFPFLLLTTVVLAQDISWNGGTGRWDDPQNWTPNRVPTANDWVAIFASPSLVYIEKGTSAFAKRVDIGPGKELRIDGSLTVVTEASSGIVIGIHNNGNLSNAGTISIQATTIGNGDGYRGSSNSYLGNKESGNIYISGFRSGVFLGSSPLATTLAAVYNEGVFNFSHISGNAIEAFDSVFENNKGSCTFDDVENGIVIHTADGEVINNGDFYFPNGAGFRVIQVFEGVLRNQATGRIDIQGGYFFVSAIGLFSNGTMENAGYIAMSSGRVLGVSDAKFNNLPGSILKINASNGQGAISITDAGEMVNEGYIETRSGAGYSAIYLNESSTFRNLSGARVIAAGNGNGALYVDESTFINAGLLRVFSGVGPNAIYLTGQNPSISNNTCGLIDLIGGEILVNTPTSWIINEAVMYLKDPAANHVIDGTFSNTAIITDPNDRLNATGINNLGLVTNSLQGPLTAGVNVPDALRLGGVVNINSIEWFTHRNGPGAGAYDLSNNIYTPNTNAVGDKTLWLRANLNGCGNRWLKIPVQDAVPLVREETPIQPNTQIGIDHPSDSDEWRVFPNPALNDVQLFYPRSQQTDLTVEVWNQVGQLMSRQLHSAEAGHAIQVKRPHSAKAGTYRLRVMGEGMEVVVKTVVWK